MANANHVLIGLGGTGGKIIRSLRKAIYQNYRSEQPRNVNLRYLYVDSSDEMMKHDDPSWRILGQSVQLPLASQLLISGLNLGSVLENVNSYPGIAPWIGNRDAFRELLNSANAATIVGGQKRHLGRFLFACQVQKFREQLQSLVRDMEVGGVSGTNFHVLTGLAGGTGSGSVVDVLTQIRLLYPDKSNRIILYALLPDRTPPANRAQANYHANGYAALLELNAMAVGAWKPHDVSGQRKSERPNIQDPFNNCYLFSDENEERIKVDLDKELPDIVASFLFQKIVATASVTWDALRRMETYENMDFRAEESPVSKHAERSRLFCTFGIKQVAYPEEEIHEYMTYQFAREAALQLQYNRWSDSVGFLDESTNSSFNEFVRAKENVERWRLTDEHLALSAGILNDEVSNRRWKPINQFWLDLQPHFQSTVRESFKDERVWLAELAKMYQQAFNDNYRDLGVRKFYETKRQDCNDHARDLRSRIEQDLFQDWVNGARSMQDTTRLVTALIGFVDEFKHNLDDRIQRVQETVREAQARVQATGLEWSHINLINAVLGKRTDVFNAQAQNLTQLYTAATRVEGMHYAKYLCEFLMNQLNELSNEVSRSASTIEDATKAFATGIEARLADSGQDDLKRQVVRFYKPGVVKDFVKSMVRDRTLQMKQTAAVRQAIASLLGDSRTFVALNARVPREKFTSVLESTCEQNAQEAHNNYVSENKDRTRVLGVSVIERLNREYGGNPEALRSYLVGILNHAKVYVRFNGNEEGKRGAGTYGNKVSALTFMLPDSQELPDFRETLRSEFYANAQIAAKEVIKTTARQSEITLVTLTNLFPARYLEDVAFLKERYQQRTSAADGEQARFELYSEGDGSQLPDLFLPEADPKRYLANLLIAKCAAQVQVLEDPDTGVSALYLVLTDERGLPLDPIRLGKDFAEAASNPNPEATDGLAMAVNRCLASEYLHQAKRDELMKKVIAEVDAIRAERKNPLDKTVRAYSEAARVADGILQKREA